MRDLGEISPGLGEVSSGGLIAIGLFFLCLAILRLWTEFERDLDSLLQKFDLPTFALFALGVGFLVLPALRNFLQPKMFAFLRKGLSVFLIDRGNGKYVFSDVGETPGLANTLHAEVVDVSAVQQPDPLKLAELPIAVQRLLGIDQEVHACWTCQPRSAIRAVFGHAIGCVMGVVFAGVGLTMVFHNPPSVFFDFIVVSVCCIFLFLGIVSCIQPWRTYKQARDSLHVLTGTRVLTFERRGEGWCQTASETQFGMEKRFGWETMDRRSIPLETVLGSIRIVAPDGMGTLLLHTGWHTDYESKRLTPKYTAFYGVVDVQSLALQMTRLSNAARRRAVQRFE